MTRSIASTAPTNRRKSAKQVSSGCIRMRDMDAIDLYSRAHVGTPVVVQ